MKFCVFIAFFLTWFSALPFSHAEFTRIKWDDEPYCTGMYLGYFSFGKYRSVSKLQLTFAANHNWPASIIFYEASLGKHIGFYDPFSKDQFFVCTNDLYNKGHCGLSMPDEIIVQPNSGGKQQMIVGTYDPSDDISRSLQYISPSQGYYCIRVLPMSSVVLSGDLAASNAFDLHIIHPHGELPADMLFLADFHFFMTVVLSICFCYWLISIFIFWADCYTHHFVILALLCLSPLMYFGSAKHFIDYNRTGKVSFVSSYVFAALSAFHFLLPYVISSIVGSGVGLSVSSLHIAKTVFGAFLAFGFAFVFYLKNYIREFHTKPTLFSFCSISQMLILHGCYFTSILKGLTKTVHRLFDVGQTIKGNRFKRFRRLYFVALLLLILYVIIYLLQSPVKLVSDWPNLWVTEIALPSFFYLLVLLPSLYLWRPKHRTADELNENILFDEKDVLNMSILTLKEQPTEVIVKKEDTVNDVSAVSMDEKVDNARSNTLEGASEVSNVENISRSINGNQSHDSPTEHTPFQPLETDSMNRSSPEEDIVDSGWDIYDQSQEEMGWKTVVSSSKRNASLHISFQNEPVQPTAT